MGTLEEIKQAAKIKLTELCLTCLNFSGDGLRIAIGGEKGRIRNLQWNKLLLDRDIQVKEKIHDVKFLNTNQLLAVAQKKYIFIYDKHGSEINCLVNHLGAQRLEFLRHHMLLASVGKGGILRYQDISIGKKISEHKTSYGTCNVMRQNPWNAVLCLGHYNGIVSMWTPNVAKPVTKILCHRGSVTTVAVDTTGNYLVTTGIDQQLKMWDIRTLNPLYQYVSKDPITCTDISDKGLLAVGYGRRIEVWNQLINCKEQSKYSNHVIADGSLKKLVFHPYEDTLVLCHSAGIATIKMPDTAKKSPTALLGNNFIKKKDIISSFSLNKLQPDMISLNPEHIDKTTKHKKKDFEKIVKYAMNANIARFKVAKEVKELRNKMKENHKLTYRQRKKKIKIIHQNLPEIKKLS